MHALNIEVSCTVGVGTDQDPSLRKMQTQQFDALLQCTCLTTPEWTQHQRRDLNAKIKAMIVSTYMYLHRHYVLYVFVHVHVYLLATA